jgi:hypothetical protein
VAQLGKLVFAIKDPAGNALSGVSVEVRKQGAQINGAHAGANTTFTVDDPGAIIAGDQVNVDTGSTTRSVSSITATTVVVGGAGFDDVDDDSRLTDITLPTIYNDAIGNETKSNPLTTDAAGEVFCWMVGGKYDVLVSGGGATTKLYTDQTATGGESVQSTIFSGTAYKYDTVRALAATDLLLDLSTAGTNKFKVMGDGEIVAGEAGATHALTGTLSVSGATTLTGGIATSTALTGTLTASTGLVATTGNIQATAGDFDGRRLKMDNGTALVDGDVTLGAGWGNTATATMQAGSTDTRGAVLITCGGAGIAADPNVLIVFKDGTYGATTWPLVSHGGTNQSPEIAVDWVVSTSSATQMNLIFVGTPSNTFSYLVRWYLIG